MAINEKELMAFAFLGFILLFQGCLLISPTEAAVRYYDFVLMEKNFTKLCSTKSILTVNGKFPGPEIRVHTGDTVFVNVHNNGTYGVTIHWHGVKQPRNPWSDGPEYITQCPIAPGSSFTQKIIFSTEVGTVWWHAHSEWTRSTVHGPIVVLPRPGTPYPFPKPFAEQTLVLGAWYKGDVKQMVEHALEYSSIFIADAYTINGEPGDLFNCSKDTTYKLVADYGKTYLLRVINSLMNEEMWFGIANHTLTLVGMDGSYLKPVTVNQLMITPGQSMDILVTANQTPSHYYIKSSPFIDSRAPALATGTTTVIQYRGTYTPPPVPHSPTLPSILDTVEAAKFTSVLRSLGSKEYPVSVPEEVTERILMTLTVNQLPASTCPNNTCLNPRGTRLSASLNNISFVAPTTDILQAYYKQIPKVYEKDFPDQPPRFFNFTGTVGANVLIPQMATKVKMIKYGSTVEIVWQGTNVSVAENHPMHLHGYSFYVVGQGFGNFDSQTSPKTYNLVDPPEVSTAGVPRGGWTAVRFKADNPGVWFMHCHVEWHSSWGMDTVLIVEDGATRETSMIPMPNDMPKCGLIN